MTVGWRADLIKSCESALRCIAILGNVANQDQSLFPPCLTWSCTEDVPFDEIFKNWGTDEEKKLKKEDVVVFTDNQPGISTIPEELRKTIMKYAVLIEADESDCIIMKNEKKKEQETSFETEQDAIAIAANMPLARSFWMVCPQSVFPDPDRKHPGQQRHTGLNYGR